ncbi:glycosyltransferase family 4 protein [uncultured Alcanivorax sp.]|jgi:glycosyltransferase involved in cell wall biosynthesis|uniref:glycosyltransferase family 4 protein n=1 Tax=uncultured Alcanivorax sp. TaxID=191215 RepID=UPI00258BDB7A|nr:glycosyltransferase family 4 protein [uncultured Alcanivorax sp.]
MSSKKFLLLGSYPDSLLNFRGDLIDALLLKGYEVHVAAPDLALDSEIRACLELKGCVVHNVLLSRAATNPIQDIKTFFLLLKLIKEVRSAYVLTYTIKPVIYGSIAAWVLGVPQRYALVTGLGYAFTGDAKGLRRVLRYIVQRLYRLALSRTGKVFFQNPDDETLFREKKILSPAIPSCIVNGSGVDISKYSVCPLPEQPVFLMIARLLGDKGVREYAQAAVVVKRVYPEARFLLVGWIDNNPDAITEQELDKWISEGAVEFLGKLSDVRIAIQHSSVYVLPSYREGTPRTVLEAMAMGRAVITTNAPGCRETVINGDNGYLVPVRDVQALAAAMVTAIESPDDRARMGGRSRAIAEEKYDVHKVNEVMLQEMGIQ